MHTRLFSITLDRDIFNDKAIILKNFFIPNSSNGYKPYLLRNGALFFYTLILLFVNTFSGVFGLSQVDASSITSSNIVSLTNVEREKQGMGRLTTNAKLSAAALAKANNMLEEQYWDHFGPNGETPWQFIKGSGYTYKYAGENLAKGFKTAEGVVQAWMASPTHRENLLSGNYLEIGVAAVSGELLGENVILVVQMFGNQTGNTTPTPDLPAPGANPNQGGQTKSISITAPKDGEITNDVRLKIKGSVSNVDTPYTVVISDKESVIGESESSGSTWEYTRGPDWVEGEHEIEAQIKGAQGSSDSVIFHIDATPPTTDIDQIKLVENQGVWTLTFPVFGDVESVSLVSAGTTFQSIKNGEEFSIEISRDDIGQRVLLIMSDELGNTSETDITSVFPIEEGEDIGPVLGTIQRIDYRTTFNILFATFILALIGAELYIYIKKGMLAKGALSIFTIGVWWLLLVIGILNGFGGNIS